MTWLVIGANGQLGTALSVVLSSRGINHTAWGSKDLDIRLRRETIQRITHLAPTVTINAAAWTDVDGAESDPDQAFAVNAEGPLNVALGVKAVGSLFAHISTDYVFSGTSKSPWNENDAQAPISVYGKSKAAGEKFILEECEENSYIFRTAWLFSPWGKNFAKTMTHFALIERNEIRVVSDQIGQPTSAVDLANQIVDTVIAKLPVGIYHATNSGEASWFELATHIFNLCGEDSSRLLPIKSTEFPRLAGRPAYSVLGHDAWASLGINLEQVPRMRSWMDALADIMPSIIQKIESEVSQK